MNNKLGSPLRMVLSLAPCLILATLLCTCRKSLEGLPGVEEGLWIVELALLIGCLVTEVESR